MTASRWFRMRAAIGTGVFLSFVLSSVGQNAIAVTPESPEVKTAIGKAVKFLESDAASDHRVGAEALIGLVLLKSHADASVQKHPRVRQAATSIHNAVKGEPENIHLDIYSAGLAVIFLVTLDSSEYGDEIGRLLKFLKLRQKPHGGWGYPEKETGDTSMTQYGVLSAWEATQAGYKVSPETIEAVTQWLLKTQDPTGAFGYQGTVSPTTALVKQRDVRHSMAAAGLGSLYICADLLGFTPRAQKRDENLPSALKEIKAAKPAPAEGANPAANIDPRRVREAEIRGNAWITRHRDLHRKEWWTFYYLYAYERYASFRELAEGRSDREPAWYSEGAGFLLRSQAEDGSWSTTKSTSGKTADTAFATLFLLRSSRKSIEKAYGFGDSTLVAGRGLPKDTANVAVSRGKVLPVPRWTSAQELSPILEKPDGDAFQSGIAALVQLPAPEAAVLAAKHPDLLLRLVADRSPQARIAAVRALGNSGDLEQAGTLIRALGDPDMEVVYEACDAMRRLTRSLGKEPLSRPMSEARRNEEIQHWKAWYLSVRPEVEIE
jgi:hypothetical protein